MPWQNPLMLNQLQTFRELGLKYNSQTIKVLPTQKLILEALVQVQDHLNPENLPRRAEVVQVPMHDAVLARLLRGVFYLRTFRPLKCSRVWERVD